MLGCGVVEAIFRGPHGGHVCRDWWRGRKARSESVVAQDDPGSRVLVARVSVDKAGTSINLAGRQNSILTFMYGFGSCGRASHIGRSLQATATHCSFTSDHGCDRRCSLTLQQVSTTTTPSLRRVPIWELQHGDIGNPRPTRCTMALINAVRLPGLSTLG